MMRHILIGFGAALLSTAMVAQEYPSRALRFIVPAPPGGPNDAIARLVGQRLADRLGQQVVIDNRGGASGLIGSELAAKSPADGYTLVMGYAGPFSINPALQAKLPYDPIRDFAPITMLAQSQNLLVVHPSFEPRNLRELIAAAKAKPGELNYASGGSGQSTHLSMELLMQMAGIKIAHIPYKGTGPALGDAIAGRVHMHFVAVVPAIPVIKAGKLIPIASTGSTRVRPLPEVPTMAEAGLPGYEVLTWYAAFTRAGTPGAIVSRLHQELVAILASPDIQEQFEKQGLEPGGGSPEALGKLVADELVKWRRVVANAGIKSE
jgi:tripartite-type tricarboxylate transporter receptor subunit TctC